jgi:hypothetical protein
MLNELYFRQEFDKVIADNGWDRVEDRLDGIYQKVKLFEMEEFNRAMEWLKDQRYFQQKAFIRELWNHKDAREVREAQEADNRKFNEWWNIVQKNREHGCDNDRKCEGCAANDPENITCHIVLDACAKGLADILNSKRTANEVETERKELFGF